VTGSIYGTPASPRGMRQFRMAAAHAICGKSGRLVSTVYSRQSTLVIGEHLGRSRVTTGRQVSPSTLTVKCREANGDSPLAPLTWADGSRERGFGTLKHERLYIDEIDDASCSPSQARRGVPNPIQRSDPHEAIAWNRPKEVHLGQADPTIPTFQRTETLPTS
jgi:hypothetical protein